MKALRNVKVNTCRGPVSFDSYGNVIGNVYIRKVVRKEGRLVNSIIKTYPNVSQFWTYDAKHSSPIRSTRAIIRRLVISRIELTREAAEICCFPLASRPWQ